MARSQVRIGLLVLCAILFLAMHLAAMPSDKENHVAANVKLTPVEPPRTQRLTEKLAQPVTLEPFNADTPLEDALSFISSRHGINILIDTEAFKRNLQVMEPQKSHVCLPKMVNIKLSTVLQLLVEQAQGEVVRKGNVVWIVPQGSTYLLDQKVNAEFDKLSLAEALRELSELTGVAVILDAHRAGDKAEIAIHAELKNMSLRTAVRILANMAELESVTIDGVLYVTTPQNAKTLKEAEQPPIVDPCAGPGEG